jgi:hypothetical protein
LWFDVSPLRPDEYGRQDAERWTEISQLQNAVLAGIAKARDEAAGYRAAMNPNVGRVG